MNESSGLLYKFKNLNLNSNERRRLLYFATRWMFCKNQKLEMALNTLSWTSSINDGVSPAWILTESLL